MKTTFTFQIFKIFAKFLELGKKKKEKKGN